MDFLKISRLCVCKMAVLFALVFSACSDQVAGGSSEEPSVVASLENITVKGMAKLFIASSEDSVEKKIVSSVLPGSIVRLVELDSVTLDTTGTSYFTYCSDSTGVFSFDSISLKSPYVMLELAPYRSDLYWNWDGKWSFAEYDESRERYTVTYNVVVDVRKAQDVGINAMTYLETARLRYLVNQGMGFDRAKQQSDRELLDAVGLYGETFDYDKNSYAKNENHMIPLKFVDSFIDECAHYRSPSRIANAFGSTGSLSAVDSVKMSLVYMIEDWITYGRNSDENRAFMNNFMAALYGMGPCDAGKEGLDSTVAFEDYRNIVFKCRSESWNYTFRYVVPDSVNATFGTMTDSRDGKKYNTVTYNINGIPQTWLAENLQYGSEDGLYTLAGAMNLPDSIVQYSYEECLEEHLDYRYCDAIISTEGLIKFDRLWTITDSVKSAGLAYQGACPDGWHLPDAGEWDRLRRFVEKNLDVESYYYLDIMQLFGFGETLPVEKGFVKYAAKVDKSLAERKAIAVLIQYWKWLFLNRVEYSDNSEGLFVRCVKN